MFITNKKGRGNDVESRTSLYFLHNGKRLPLPLKIFEFTHNCVIIHSNF